MGAFIIDMLIKYSYGYLAIHFFASPLIEMTPPTDSWTTNAIYIICLFPAFIYSVTLETLLNGQTVGKKLMAIKVIKIKGYQTSFMDHLTRWIFRLVDISSSLGLLGLISIMTTKNHQRLGDLAAGTAIITLKQSTSLEHTILEEISEMYQPTYPEVIKFSDNDIRIIKETYEVALKSQDFKTMSKLVEKIEEVSGIKPKENLDMFISKIIRDYNYYTGN